jgi:integrase
LAYLKEKSNKKSLNYDLLIFKVLADYIDKNTLLINLTRDEIMGLLDELQDERNISTARINRYASLIRCVLNLSADVWEWIPKAPKVFIHPEDSKRIRWIKPVEASNLIAFAPQHLKYAIQFALATGVRKANLFSLKWSQIDMQRHCAWIYGDEAKGKRDIAIPLNQDAIDALKHQIGKHSINVFTYQGKPMTKPCRQTWFKILNDAKIDNFRWHDLRHTWASWHVQSGTSLNELMELGGWSSLKMVMRYAHLSSDSLKDAAENIATKMTQSTIVSINAK